MPMLNDLMPEPRLRELDSIELESPPEAVFDVARHFDIASVPLAAALFWLRALPERLRTHAPLLERPHLRFDEIGQEARGFRVLVDEPGRFAVGAIGRFWLPEMEFATADVESFARFADAGWGKILWEVRSEVSGSGARIVFELRLTATDDDAWRAFRRYYRTIAPFSRFFRRHGLQQMAKRAGRLNKPAEAEATKPFAGDAFIASPRAAVTHAITIDAPPSAVFPWLVQMGCSRAGWYSYDDLDNAGIRSEIELVPELQKIAVGDVLPATPESRDGFSVLLLNAPHELVLGGLFDTERNCSLAMNADKPAAFWRSSWDFVLEALPSEKTRLIVRARVDYAPDTLKARIGTRIYALVHGFMEHAQLEHLKQRVEHRAPRVESTWTDFAEAVAGAALMIGNLATPFLREQRSHWGIDAAEATAARPGDELIPAPRWQWTHAVTVRASAEAVWPWIAQIGQDKAGFYSYQALENLAGCDLQNASHVHPEWQAREGDALRLHPKGPPLRITKVDPARALIAVAGLDPATGKVPLGTTTGETFVAVSWAFLLEALADGSTRVVSRYRCACSEDVATRLLYGPLLIEPIGFAMDRRMLLGIQERVERTQVA